MEENKNNKSLIVLIVILLICVLGLGAFVVYDKILNNNNNIDNKDDKPPVQDSNPIVDDTKPPVQNIVTEIIESEFPEYITNLSVLYYWDCQGFYNHYFKLRGEKIIGIDYYPFIKIENNKLMWNINNTWTTDSVIKNDIEYFNIDHSTYEGYAYILLLTNQNELYRIDFDKIIYNVGFPEKFKALTEEQYKYFNYHKYDFDIKIDAIEPRDHGQCHVWRVHYLSSGNKIYVLGPTNSLVDIFEYGDFATNNILNVDSRCTTDRKLKIDFDRTTSNILDHEGNKIKVKHYIEINGYPGNYDIIISDDNKLYSFRTENFKENMGIKHFGIVKDFKVYNSKGNLGGDYTDNRYPKLITIEFENGKVINLQPK